MNARAENPGAFARLARTPGVPAAFVLVLLAFGGFSLLLPVVPLAVVRGGGSELVAGATTGVFMTVTVLFQLATPRLTGIIGYRWVLGIGSALLGLPSGLLAVFDGSFAVLAISGVRGAVFVMSSPYRRCRRRPDLVRAACDVRPPPPGRPPRGRSRPRP